MKDYTLEMASNTSTKPAGARTRVSWTVEMVKDLEECRDKAKNLHQRDNAPRKTSTRNCYQRGRTTKEQRNRIK